MKTHVLLDHEPVADGGWMVHALLRLEGEVSAMRDRVPLNLSLVLDRSGSMAGDKLRVARACARYLVRRLRPVDRFALVTYDDDVELRVPLAPVDPIRLEAALAAIAALEVRFQEGIRRTGTQEDDIARRVCVPLIHDGFCLREDAGVHAQECRHQYDGDRFHV